MNRPPAALMALACLLLSGCGTQQNAVVGGALTYAEQSIAGQVGLIQRANVDAVAAWRVAACAIPLGGAAGTTDTTALKALLTACPIPGVGMVTVNENGAVSISMGSANSALPVAPAPTVASPPQITSPITVPPPVTPAAAVARARRPSATQSAVFTPIPVTPDITSTLQTAQAPAAASIQPEVVPLIPAPAAAEPAPGNIP